MTEILFAYQNHLLLFRIPRKRDFLAANKLIGKIRLRSSMSQDEIMEEIRSVFEKPMGVDMFFRFQILQKSGFRSKCLAIPEVSSSCEWSASTVAGKDAIRQKELHRHISAFSCRHHVTRQDSDEDDLPEVNLGRKTKDEGIISLCLVHKCFT